VLAQDQRGAKALWYTLLPVGKHTRAEALGGHESGGWGQLAVPACALSTPALSPRPGACPHTARASAIVHTCRGRMDCMYVVSGRLAFWSAQTHALRSYNHTTTLLPYHTAVPHCCTALLYYRTALLPHCSTTKDHDACVHCLACLHTRMALSTRARAGWKEASSAHLAPTPGKGRSTRSTQLTGAVGARIKPERCRCVRYDIETWKIKCSSVAARGGRASTMCSRGLIRSAPHLAAFARALLWNKHMDTYYAMS